MNGLMMPTVSAPSSPSAQSNGEMMIVIVSKYSKSCSNIFETVKFIFPHVNAKILEIDHPDVRKLVLRSKRIKTVPCIAIFSPATKQIEMYEGDAALGLLNDVVQKVQRKIQAQQPPSQTTDISQVLGGASAQHGVVAHQAPPQQYGAVAQSQQYGAVAQSQQYQPPPQQYSAPPQQYAAPPQQYGAVAQSQQYAAPPQQYGQPPVGVGMPGGVGMQEQFYPTASMAGRNETLPIPPAVPGHDEMAASTMVTAQRGAVGDFGRGIDDIEMIRPPEDPAGLLEDIPSAVMLDDSTYAFEQNTEPIKGMSREDILGNQYGGVVADREREKKSLAQHKKVEDMMRARDAMDSRYVDPNDPRRRLPGR